jgi:hypothetical protein
MPSDKQNKDAAVGLGAAIAFVAILYAALRTSSSSQIGKMGMTSEGNSSELLPVTSSSSTDDKVVHDEEGSVTYSWSFFHFVYACGALYLTLVITDWNVFQ